MTTEETTPPAVVLSTAQLKVTPVMKNGTIENFMPRIGGEAFRCGCGANVFHKPDDTRLELYECNGCEAWYEGA